MRPLHEISIAEAGTRFRSGSLTSEALVAHLVQRIDRFNPKLGAFIFVTHEQAQEQARRADRELAAGIDRGPMHGIPYALKDLFDASGIPTTCNSQLRVGHVPTSDSTVHSRLTAGGGVFLGKLHMHEFATGGTGPELPFPPALNPWNLGHITGGSSSGAGAAVAAGFVRVAIGSDTGGSIRQPAAYCGVVGLKPTYGRVSKRGVFPLSHSLDHCGPLTRSVSDAALAMEVLAGFDPGDPTSVDVGVDRYASGLDRGVDGLRVGVPVDHMSLADHLDDSVARALDRAIADLEHGGAIVSSVRLPDYETFFACSTAIMLAEAFSVHERGLRDSLGSYAAKTAHRLLLGAAVTGSDLVRAFSVRDMLVTQLDEVFSEHDLILTASAISGAPPLQKSRDFFSTPLQIPALPFNLTGHPAIHVPMSRDNHGMPVGLQLAARRFEEAVLLRAAHFIERTSGWTEIPLPALDSLSVGEERGARPGESPVGMEH